MGRAGSARCRLGSLANLARLYWYTVEFGLLETPRRRADLWRGHRVVENGNRSSRWTSDSPNRLGFDLERVMRTPYRIDDFQQVYFVIPSLTYLLDVTTGTDFGPLYAKFVEHARNSDRGDRTK